jgi:NAD(P)H-flavin reductase
LKAAITRHIATRPAGTPIAIAYGAREPMARIHRAALAVWEQMPDVHLIECVERRDANWPGRVGLVTDFLAEAMGRIAPRRAALCGPTVMLRHVAKGLRGAGVAPEHIHLAVERYMKCGTGHCGHCYIDHRYVCTDGPVFSLAELRGLRDAARSEAVAAAC